jgi:hypothetical protein
MKLGKLMGRIGFVVGFIPPVLFYAVLPYTLESQLACPFCPYIEVPFGHPLLWWQIGLTWGPIQGLLLASLGFGISRIKKSAIFK